MATGKRKAGPQGIAELINEQAKAILSADPNERMTASEFERKIRECCPTIQYSSHTIAQTLSSLAKLPDSNVLKIDGKIGYSLRVKETAVVPEKDTERLEEKFRLFYERYLRFEGFYPCILHHERASRSMRSASKWQFPDIVMVDWLLRRDDSDGFSEREIEARTHLSQPLYRISSIELKVAISSGKIREYFFQCLSNSKWGNESYLVIATPVKDEELVNELRRLGNSYHVNVACWSFEEGMLKKLPDTKKMTDEEFGDFLRKMKLEETRLVSGWSSPVIDWEFTHQLSDQLEEFRDFLEWAGWCVKQRKAMQWERWTNMMKTREES